MAKSKIKGTARQAQTARTREQVVMAALACFIEHGFHQTSMRMVADTAGVSLGNIYNHFQSKEELIAEIAALEADELRGPLAALQAAPDPLAGIDAFVAARVEQAGRREDVILAAEVIAEAVRNADIAKRFLDNRTLAVGVLADVLRRGQALNVIDAMLPVEPTAEFILDAVDGAALRCVLTREQPDRDTIAALRTLLKKCLSS